MDSGAVDCIFPAAIGELIGIDVPSGIPKTYFGLAQQAANGYIHKVKLQVTGFGFWTELEIGFIESDVLPLLGQHGFFSNYQVVFEGYRRRFDVNKKESALMTGRKRGH